MKSPAGSFGGFKRETHASGSPRCSKQVETWRVRRRGHLLEDRIQSSRILTTLYHTPRARSRCSPLPPFPPRPAASSPLPPPPPPLTANSSSAVVTSMETLVFNPYCHIVTPSFLPFHRPEPLLISPPFLLSLPPCFSP